MTWGCQIFFLNLTTFPEGHAVYQVGVGLSEPGWGSSHLFLVTFAHSCCHPSQTRKGREAETRGENFCGP